MRGLTGTYRHDFVTDIVAKTVVDVEEGELLDLIRVELDVQHAR